MISSLNPVGVYRVKQILKSHRRPWATGNGECGPASTYQAWHLRESSGDEAYWWWVAIGVVCGYFPHCRLAKIMMDRQDDNQPV